MLGSGVTAPGSESTTRGTGIGSGFHGIRDQGNNKNWFRDQHLFWGKTMGLVVKKYMP